MRYEMTKDLETGNALIDSEHRQLFKAVNDLLDACSQGKGRSQVESTLDFLVSYVAKHFGDEEKLQVQTSYPIIPSPVSFLWWSAMWRWRSARRQLRRCKAGRHLPVAGASYFLHSGRSSVAVVSSISGMATVTPAGNT